MKSPTLRSPGGKLRGRDFDRHSGSGRQGLPKKNGAGGKGVWGAAMDQAPVAYLDKKDPNYDSDEEVAAGEAPPSLQLAAPVVAPLKDDESPTSSVDDATAAGAPHADVVVEGDGSAKQAHGPTAASH